MLKSIGCLAALLVVSAFALPIFGISMFAAGGYTFLSSMEEDEREEVVEGMLKKIVLSDALEVPGAITQYGSVKTGYTLITKYNRLTDKRRVTIERYVEVKDLLETGEKMPDKEMFDLFVEARVLKMGKEECALLEQVIAAKCKVRHVRASRVKRIKKEIYRVEVGLSYAQRGEFGEIPSEQQYGFVEKYKKFTEKRMYRSTDTQLARKITKFMYKDIFKHCKNVRKSLGNCAIGKIEMDDRFDAGSLKSTQSMEASFSRLVQVK